MNLDRFLKLGEGAINENFVTWAEMAGTSVLRSSSVRFFTSKSGNRNRSWTDPYIEWTQPVLIGLVALKRLVQTGFLM